MVTSVILHTEAFGQPSKSQRMVALKDRWLPSLESSIRRENEKMGSNCTVKFSKAAMRPAKIREQKGPSQEITQKFELAGAKSMGSQNNSITERKTNTSNKSGVPAETLGNWQRMFTNSRSGLKYFSLSSRSLGNAGALFDKSRRATFLWSTLKLQCMCHARRTSAQERQNSQEFQIRHDSGDSQ